jgi:predicted enzyme related to lactoylglutathione lyase
MADGDVQSTPDGLTFCYVRDTEGARFSLWCPPRR